MRLYSNGTQWAGTQEEARKAWGKDWEAIDVPTKKDALIAFLNGLLKPLPTTASETPIVSEAPSKHPLSCSLTPTKFDIRDAALNADMKHLTQAVAVWTTRLDQEVLK